MRLLRVFPGGLEASDHAGRDVRGASANLQHSPAPAGVVHRALSGVAGSQLRERLAELLGSTTTVRTRSFLTSMPGCRTGAWWTSAESEGELRATSSACGWAGRRARWASPKPRVGRSLGDYCLEHGFTTRTAVLPHCWAARRTTRRRNGGSGRGLVACQISAHRGYPTTRRVCGPGFIEHHRVPGRLVGDSWPRGTEQVTQLDVAGAYHSGRALLLGEVA
jgi:hypothetical protein